MSKNQPSNIEGKPLRRKAYGSIGHLPNSRLGPGDWSVHEGQARIATIKARDKHDRIIVTEKLDGSCVAVARIGGEIHALGRAGYPAHTSPYEHIRLFGRWALAMDWRDLPEGVRVVGEWMAMAVGSRYEVNQPLVAFDVMENDVRWTHDRARALMGRLGLVGANVVRDGAPITVEEAMAQMGERGAHGALEGPEGLVYRVERKGACDFLAKFVKHGKQDGCLLPEVSGQPAVWLWGMP